MADSRQSSLFNEEIDNKNDSIKINGFDYIPKFISGKEHDDLLKNIDEQAWLLDLKRRVQHYGYKYDYKRRRVDRTMRIIDPPPLIQKYSYRLKEQEIFENVPDQVIINEYEAGQGISNHIDCEPCFEKTIASLSLGSKCVLYLTNKNNGKMIESCLLEPCSLFILKNEARYDWLHGIKPVKTDKYGKYPIRRGRRVSLTFRNVILDDR